VLVFEIGARYVYLQAIHVTRSYIQTVTVSARCLTMCVFMQMTSQSGTTKSAAGKCWMTTLSSWESRCYSNNHTTIESLRHLSLCTKTAETGSKLRSNNDSINRLQPSDGSQRPRKAVIMSMSCLPSVSRKKLSNKPEILSGLKRH